MLFALLISAIVVSALATIAGIVLWVVGDKTWNFDMVMKGFVLATAAACICASLVVVLVY